MLPVVDIGAADTGPGDSNKDFMGRTKLGDGPVAKADVLGLVQDEGEILGTVRLCKGRGCTDGGGVGRLHRDR